MYIQTLLLKLPPAGRENFEAAFRTHYLPQLQQCQGYLSSNIVEEDGDQLHLYIYWTDSGQCQCARCKGHLIEATLAFAAAVPGMEIKTVPFIEAPIYDAV